MAEYFTHISMGAGEKMGQLLQTMSATIIGITIGVAIHPWYGLALCCYLPFATLVMVKFRATIIKGVMQKMG